ncbi:MAG: 4-hydroxy-tetrahydrodipicolinate reductase [Deltaproteobacteria bacterium]|nr:4-hydroxy-tetrahydrodipicolinate reductase [Deltaproteobacteria bacterium]
MTKIIITGFNGRMGQALAQAIRENPQATLAGAIERPGHSQVGQKEAEGFEVVDDLEKCINAGEVVIDFSSPEASLKHAAICAQHNKAIVIRTTGFNESQKKELQSYLKKIPSLMAPNMSVGVNVLFQVAAEAARLLGDDYHVEIIEAHHAKKKDAPSGTALGLAESVASALKRNLKEVANYHREGLTGERPQKEIGIQTLRGGDIVGDHTVLFAGTGERLELTHRATSRQNFAQGAVRAALWLVKQKPGLYSMKEVLGLA